MMKKLIYIFLLLPSLAVAQVPDTNDIDIILDLSSINSLWEKFHGNSIYYDYPVSILKDTNNPTSELVDFLVNDVDLDGNTLVAIENQLSGSNRSAGLSIISNTGNGLDINSYGTSYSTSIFGVPLTGWSMVNAGGNGVLINTTNNTSQIKIGVDGKEKLRFEADGDIVFPSLKTGVLDSIPGYNSANELIKMKLSPDNFTIGSDVIYTKNYVETEFTTSGSYTKNPAAKAICIYCIGASGGGGSGAVNTAVNGNYAYGGTGGGSGGYSYKCFEGANVSSSPINVTVGTGGAGGAAITASTATNGNNGSFGSFSGVDGLILATGGRGGHRGVTSSTFPDLSAGNWYTNGYGNGGIGIEKGANADPGHAHLPYTLDFAEYDITYSSSAGGSATGVFWNAGIANTATSAQGSVYTYFTNQNASGYMGAGGIEATLTAPTQPTLIQKGRVCGGGGGGIPAIAGGSTHASRNGASVTLSKCSGGGGGGAGVISNSTITSGAGGNGGNGYVLIVEYF